jgi:hypothetical protein
VDSIEVEITSGGVDTVTYTLSATRSLTSTTDVAGVRGRVCVTNGGGVTTQGLKLVDQVLYKTGGGAFGPLAGASQTITPAVQLAPGASQCYNYEITFTPVPLAQYKNSVDVTITNHSGHLGLPFGPSPDADFILPGSPTITEVDEAASLVDVEICPSGFTCTPSDPGPWSLTDTDEVTFTKDIDNVSAECDTHYTLKNTATLTENDTGQSHSDIAQVDIYTGECSGGCTLTIGYWKTHAGFTGRNADRVTPLLPIWLGTVGGSKSIQVTSAPQAVTILSMDQCEGASNGITKLDAQLLGAKLNIAEGAASSAVASTITAADTFLATHNCSDWSSLSRADKNTVLGWMSTLDNYNNGLVGPGHCQ